MRANETGCTANKKFAIYTSSPDKRIASTDCALWSGVKISNQFIQGGNSLFRVATRDLRESVGGDMHALKDWFVIDNERFDWIWKKGGKAIKGETKYGHAFYAILLIQDRVVNRASLAIFPLWFCGPRSDHFQRNQILQPGLWQWWCCRACRP